MERGDPIEGLPSSDRDRTAELPDPASEGMREEERGAKRPALDDDEPDHGELGAANRDEPLPERERPNERLSDEPPEELPGALLGEITCGALWGAVARELVRGENVRGDSFRGLLWGAL